MLRIHAVFDDDTDEYNTDIASLINDTIEVSGSLPGKIWVGNHNLKLIDFLKSSYQVTADTEIFHYDSIEYRIDKKQFNNHCIRNLLSSRPYDEHYFDNYLMLLNDSMSFFIPPHDYMACKQKYMREFQEYKTKNTFEAFWKEDTLIGLYWLQGAEIDSIAVSPAFQRQGYGSVVLAHAIQRVFDTNDTTHAKLYSVGWNSKAQFFYQSFGMEKYAQYRVQYTSEN